MWEVLEPEGTPHLEMLRVSRPREAEHQEEGRTEAMGLRTSHEGR